MSTPPPQPSSLSPPQTLSAAEPLAKAYRPSDTETRIRARWDDAKAFHADPERVLRGEAKPYCIFIPPPNVTAALHLGHALNNTIQDVLARVHRMRGYETLWMPGTDHAGIATQAVVEKRVLKETGKRRQEFGRDEFVAKIQSFKDEYEAIITDQLKVMGCSCDWDRQRFTMDPQCAAAVREAFFRLFKDGLIYRGKRLVNWDPALQTAVADDECFEQELDAAFYYLRYPLVEWDGGKAEQVKAVTWGKLAERGYPGAADHPADQPAWVTVATTRPETYLGDVAVGMNPRDPRLVALRGLKVRLPLVGRILPIVADDYVVLPAAMQADPEAAASDPKAAYASGFLKVTPAHDQNDYDLYFRHKAEIDANSAGHGLINVMAPDAAISDKHGWSDIGEARLFLGLSREAARKKVVEEFKARGLLEGIKPYRHSVKHSDRSKAAVEPYLSDQWYVKVTDPRLAASANEAVRSGDMEFFPARYGKTYEHWHDNIRDWCISRQLWWGHRIPVWRCRIDSAATGDWKEGWGRFVFAYSRVMDRNDAEFQAYGLSSGKQIHLQIGSSRPVGGLDEPAEAFVCLLRDDQSLIADLEQRGYVRDPDVLDTWFSSALWPLSTLGWPSPDAFNADANRGLLEAFNPSSVLCTAREIITLWVSRMVMMNRYLHGEGLGRGPVPFRHVYVHAVIQDGEGRKMSKSLGNGVDPRDIIASHGADAMRFTLMHMTTQTQDVRLPVEPDPTTGKNTSPKFDLGRNVCNKLWNAARFALSKIPLDSSGPNISVSLSPASLPLIDRWMLARLHSAMIEINDAIANYEFSRYAHALYDLMWRDFCDWYLEAIKPTVESSPRQQAVLAHALEVILRVLHPIAPFITEAIWERVREIETATISGITLAPSRKGGLLCTAGWPIIDAADTTAETDFEQARELITAIREVRAQHNVSPKRRVTLHIGAHAHPALRHPDAAALVQQLAGVDNLSTLAPAGQHVGFRAADGEFELSNLAEIVDSGAERDRLKKLEADLSKSISVMEGRLNNPGYIAKAPPKLVEESRAELAKKQSELAGIRASLELLR